MSYAMDVAARIEREETILSDCAARVRARQALSIWPEATAAAFLGALAEDPIANERERQKARDLARHLFRGRPGPAPKPEFARTTTAERVRADLMGCVPLGAGIYLTRTSGE